MPEVLFSRYRELIRGLDLAQVNAPAQIPDAFLLGREGRYSAHYIPFESVHAQARVVVAGITPGFAQWKNAMREAQHQLAAGRGDDEVLRAARLAGAFSGAIRPNFVALLDAIGVQRWLGIASCASLFGADAGLVQVGAILRHPIFVDGKNYSGSPSPLRQSFLRDQVLRWFAEEARMLPDALYIPMGASVSETLDWLVTEGVIPRGRVLHGLPHPSGANAERVAYFLGRKERAALSGKTNGAQIDAARAALLAQMDELLVRRVGGFSRPRGDR
ncbi:hypothetical protein [Massilia sp. IC2-476]|uniref:hypothetical protein n=1 Tax=Massilia sp. IC2-476 TaxID=2887199 RepID=UPI001D12562E|nr:hypothetical protein [Massilia sp. IC2-476]MCC2971830.1 hypothetical protein [Massilia sp. IC2-476]